MPERIMRMKFHPQEGSALVVAGVSCRGNLFSCKLSVNSSSGRTRRSRTILQKSRRLIESSCPAWVRLRMRLQSCAKAAWSRLFWRKRRTAALAWHLLRDADASGKKLRIWRACRLRSIGGSVKPIAPMIGEELCPA